MDIWTLGHILDTNGFSQIYWKLHFTENIAFYYTTQFLWVTTLHCNNGSASLWCCCGL